MRYDTVEDVRAAVFAHNEGCLDPSDADAIGNGSPVIVATVRNFTRHGVQICANVTRYMAVDTCEGIYAAGVPVFDRWPVGTLAVDELGDDYMRDTADVRDMVTRMSVAMFGDWPVRVTILP